MEQPALTPAAGARLSLAACFVAMLALCLRLQGLAFGLDPADIEQVILNNNLDERGMVEAVQRNLLHGNLDPGSFVFRGPGGFLLFGGADALLVAGLGLARAEGFDAARSALTENPSLLFLCHRLVNALAGVLTVVLLFRLARREFGLRCALAAGVFLACAYAHVRDSHFGTVDVLWSLFGLAALDAMLLWQRAAGGRGVWRVGVLFGLALALKYHAIFLALPLLVAAWRVAAGRAGAARWLSAAKSTALASLVALLVFLLLFPGLLVAPESFRSIVGFQLATNTAAANNAEPLKSILFHLRHSLATGLGEPVFALALLGAVLAWRRGGAARWFTLCLLLLSPLLFATSAHPVRYAMGVLPLCALLAGLALERLTARRAAPVFALGLALAALPSLVRVLTLNALLPRQDTRVEMLAELRARALPPEDVLAVGTHHGIPSSARRGERLFTSYVNVLLGDGLRRGNLRIDPEFEARLEQLLRTPPRLILWDGSREELVIPGKDRLAELVRTRYSEVLRLDGRKGDFPLPELSEDAGAHMIPYARPWSMSRPGPPLVLYERID